MTTLAVSDLHFPFAHADAIDFVADLYRSLKPDHVVLLGDEIDAHGWSRHDHDPDAPGSASELTLAVAEMKKLYKLFRGGRNRGVVNVCRSNHGERAARTAIPTGIPSTFIRTLREVLEAPYSWQWADRWLIDGVCYEHGEGYTGVNSALHAARNNRTNTVIGHVHSWAGVQYHASAVNVIWGMNCGCLIDIDAPVFRYARARPHKAVIGTGVVEDGVPRFVPLYSVSGGGRNSREEE